MKARQLGSKSREGWGREELDPSFLPGMFSFPGCRLWAAPRSLSTGISDTGFRGAAPPRGPGDSKGQRERGTDHDGTAPTFLSS